MCTMLSVRTFLPSASVQHAGLSRHTVKPLVHRTVDCAEFLVGSISCAVVHVMLKSGLDLDSNSVQESFDCTVLWSS